MEINEDKWLKLFNECDGDVYQSLEWSKVNEKKGKKPIFLTIEENNELKAGLLCFESKIKLTVLNKKILAAEGTPLFKSEEYGIKILEKFKELAKKYFYATIAPSVMNPQDDLFKKQNLLRVDNHTILIELSKIEEELFSKLEKKSARWGVNTALKNGIVIKEAELHEVAELFHLYELTCMRGDLKPEPYEFFRAIHTDMRLPNKGKVFVAKKYMTTIAGAILLLSNDRGILNLTGASEKGLDLQAMNLIYWHLIKYCKEIGKKYLDLGGYDPDAKADSKIYHINKFKERFGGKVAVQPLYTTSQKYLKMRSMLKSYDFLRNFYSKDK